MTDLASLIKQEAYLKGQFTTRAGKQTDYYIDKYKFTTQPHILKPLCEALSLKMPPSDTYDLIGAPELGAVAIASVVSVLVNKPFIIIKKESKAYGTQRLIEGSFNQGDRVFLLEDILTTGGAVLRCARVLVEQGLTVVGILGVINRQEGAFEAIQALGYCVDALFSTEDLKAV